MTNLISLNADKLEFDPDSLRAKYAEERAKRLRPEGIHQYRRPEGNLKQFEDDPYADQKISRSACDDEIDVAIIGGGFAGLLTAVRLREAGVKDIHIIEKGSDFGGVWYWNRYPGAACDTESYVYLPLLEETGYMPPSKFVQGKDIRTYAQAIARQYDLYDDALLQTQVNNVEWDADKGRWTIHTDRGDTLRARFVCNTNGTLSRPKFPGIPGIERFSGHMFHTSRWDYNYTGGNADGGLTGLVGKRVGIIGTGATSVQCIPHLAETAEHLYVFQRTPSSIDVRDDSPTDETWYRSQCRGWHEQRRNNFNALLSGVPVDEDLVEDGWTEIGRTISEMIKLGQDETLTPEDIAKISELADFQKMEQIRARIDELVADKGTAELLKPWYRQFCKRPCVHNDYLPTFNRNNVTLVDTDGRGIDSMNERGVVVAGKSYPVDCMIFSTGFETGTLYTQRSGYDITGVDGLKLSEKWRDGVASLHGMTSRHFPNCFFMSNFQSGFTLNFTHALDEEARHIAYLIDYGLSNDLKMMQPSQEGESSWVDVIEQTAGALDAFFDSCTPGYYNDEGQAREKPKANNWFGGGSIAFFDLIRKWRMQGLLAGMELTTK